VKLPRLPGSLALPIALLTAAGSARGAGLYFSDRGVRPMGRAGAFVAGADDASAIWYNPAGLADAKSQLLFDAAWLRFSATYDRELRVLDADDVYRTVRSPRVSGSSPFIPIPTIAATYQFGKDKEWTLAGGLLAPYVAITTYPETVNGQPSPARYASIRSYDGTLMAIPGVWMAYKPTEAFRFGMGLQALVGMYRTTVIYSVSPEDRLAGAPEQPEFDAESQINVGPIFAPTANMGATVVPDEKIRFGVSGQLPTIISSSAKIKVRLPTNAVFDDARVTGDTVHVKIKLPAIFRFGVELRPWKTLRAELAYVRELWSIHESIDSVPEGVSIDNVPGLPPQVKIPPLVIPRSFQDSHSLRVGGEYTLDAWGYPLSLRAGFAYETSAVPRPYLSLLTVDMNKTIFSLGGSLHVGERWRLDAVFAHLSAASVYVSPDQAKIPRLNPIKGNAPLEAVNGGTYDASANLFGVGVVYKF
jgi:long-chain fatty acid transport protein